METKFFAFSVGASKFCKFHENDSNIANSKIRKLQEKLALNFANALFCG